MTGVSAAPRLRPPAGGTLRTPSVQVAAGVLVLTGVLSLAAWVGPALLASVVALAGLALAWGWAGALALPSPRGTAVVLAVGAVVTTVATGARPGDPGVTWLPAALSVAVLAALFHQLLRRDGRPRLVESLTGVTMGLAVIGCGALLVPVAHRDPGPALVAAALAASAVSALVDVAGRWPSLRPWLVPAGMLAGGATAVLVTTPAGIGVPPSTALLLGVAAAVVGHAVRVVLAVLPTMAHARPRLVAVVASTLAPGAVTYPVAHLLLPQVLPSL